MSQPVFEQRLELKDSNFTQASITGRTFGGNGFAVRSGSMTSITGSLRIDSPSSAVMTLDGKTYQLTNFGGQEFSNLSGSKAVAGTRLRNAPVTPDVLYLLLSDTPAPSLLGPRVAMIVDGNKTAASRLPTGSLRYSGLANSRDTGMRTATGTAVLDVDFARASATMTLSGVNPLALSETYRGSALVVSGGGFGGTLSGGSAIGGSVSGNIYGATGTQAAGVFSIATPTNGIAGMFGAVR